MFWNDHVGIMLDAARLLHANGTHMAVAIEALADANAAGDPLAPDLK